MQFFYGDVPLMTSIILGVRASLLVSTRSQQLG